MEEFLSRKFLGNSMESYLWFALILVVGLILKRFLSKVLTHCIYQIFKKKSSLVGSQKLLEILTPPFSLFFLLLTFYLAFDRLEFPYEWSLVPEHEFGVRMVMFRIFQAAIILSITWIVIRVVDFIGLVLIERARKTDSRTDDMVIPYAKEIIKVLLAGIGFLVMLAFAFKLDVVSLVAGLGIGGLAFALAGKETLENLLGSFTIFLDKPFVVGDQVKVGVFEGFVESIGFRSTRIRSLEKNVVIVPNKKMVDAELINESDRYIHRARFMVSLMYNTPVGTIQKICDDLKAMLNDHKDVAPAFTVRFRDLSVSSLDILVVYFVNTSDPDYFLEVKESVNFGILKIVETNNARFAFNSTSVYIENQQEQK